MKWVKKAIELQQKAHEAADEHGYPLDLMSPQPVMTHELSVGGPSAGDWSGPDIVAAKVPEPVPSIEAALSVLQSNGLMVKKLQQNASYDGYGIEVEVEMTLLAGSAEASTAIQQLYDWVMNKKGLK